MQVGFTQYTPRSGDSIAFDSAEPHLLENEGTEPAAGVIWFVLGRRQAAGGRRQAPEALLARTAGDGDAAVLRYPPGLG